MKQAGIILNINFNEISFQLRDSYLIGDESQLQNILKYMLYDALKYSAKGGVMTVAVVAKSKYVDSEGCHQHVMRIEIGYEKVQYIKRFLKYIYSYLILIF